MTVMIPSTSVRAKTSSEERVFVRIRDGLPDDWYAIHSLGLAHHRTKPWAEIDFVLVGPPGVICLEVKGGCSVEIDRDGRWVYHDCKNPPVVRNESPFAQVGSASTSLYQWALQHQAPRSLITGWAVMFPNFVFRRDWPEVVQELVYDDADERLPFAKYLDRVVGYWQERLGRKSQMDEREVRQVVDMLAPAFSLTRKMRSRVAEASEQLIRLTEQQCEIVENLEITDRVVVQGGAGTGKTLLALSEAERMTKRGNKVLLCCFNRNLASSLRHKTVRTDLAIGTLHSEMRRLCSLGGLDECIPKDASANDVNLLYLPDCAARVLKEYPEEKYDVLVLDEAQDVLNDAYLEVLDGLVVGGLQSGRWRIMLDPHQDVYSQVSRSVWEAIDSAHPTRWPLNVNCRNTKPIALRTAALARVPSARTLVVDGPMVEVHYYRDAADQSRRVLNILNRLLSEGLTPDQVVLLGPKRLENSVVADAAFSIPIVHLEEAEGRKAIAYSTISGFKGLESDVVVLVDVEQMEGLDSLLYVGMSRAIARLEMLVHDKARAQYDERLVEFGVGIGADSSDVD